MVALVLPACLAVPAFAARAERGPAGEIRRAPQGVARARGKSADQIAAASDAARAGLDIRWDEGQGTPRRVRGLFPGVSNGPLSKGGGDRVVGNKDADRAASALAGVGRLFGFRQVSREFRLRRSAGDELGFRHVRMEQMHEGLRVVGGELVAHFDAGGGAYEVNGSYVADLSVVAAAGLPPGAAVRAAQDDLRLAGAGRTTPARPHELVVFALRHEPVLAYELRMALDPQEGIGSWRCWVDANSGEILLRYSDLRTVAAPTANGVSATISGSMLAGEGGGVTNVTGWRENTGLYYLNSTQRWWQIRNASPLTQYTDKSTYAYRATADWGTSDRAEISLAAALQTVQGHYFSMFGLRSFDGAGGLALANVHYGSSYVNAFWDGDAGAFYFGDGDGVRSDKLSVLDITGHEYGHAVTEHTAGLIYAYESGALDESFADISGACVEFMAQRDGRSAYGSSPYHVAGRADWLIGEDCWLSSPALRDMRAPANTATVGAGNEQPSRYLGSYWYSGTADNGGVHYNSGVQNFFFYLLSDGGSGVNDGISYSVSGIGVSNAARVAYRTVTVYCTPSTDHAAVRDAWLSAAADLNPAWVGAVDAAWNAVGLGGLRILPDRGLNVVGPVGGPFAPLARTYTLQNKGATPLSWSATHSQPWLTISAQSGTLAGGAATNLSIGFGGGINSLAKGTHADVVVFSNALSRESRSLVFSVQAGVPDYVTESFDSDDNDLSGIMLTFRPDPATTSYTATAESITEYPTPLGGGAPLALPDDGFAMVTLPGDRRVRLFGVAYDRFFVGSNGYITFGQGDNDAGESVADHFAVPRISALFNDLDPSKAPGSVTWVSIADRTVVTYDRVPQYGKSNSNRVQIEMFTNGTIRFSYPSLALEPRTQGDGRTGVVGLSAGGGTPAGFVESDLNRYALPPVLRVTPASFAFGPVQAGTEREAVFTVMNQGECFLRGTASVTGVFSVVSGASYDIPSGTTHAVRVRYAPAAAGVHSNNLILTEGGGAQCAVTGRAIGNGDPDGDGMSDWEEYLAGTSPTDGNDYFRISDLPMEGGKFVIRWPSITGRWYTVSASTNLPGSWTNVHTASGTGTEMRYAHPPEASTDFLRVRVQGE